MSRRRVRHAPQAAGVSPRSLVLRQRFLLACWLCSCGVLVARAAELQIAQGAEWKVEAERQHRMRGEVAAARGAILDREGLPLALSHEAFRVGVAPHELSDRAHAAEVLATHLNLTQSEASRITSSERTWVTVPGRFPPVVREALSGMRGVYIERELRRSYPHETLSRGLLGAVVDGVGGGGVEQQFEEHLRGMPGTEVLSRDSSGRGIPGETWVVVPPRTGGSVVLTLDLALQEIAHEALADAMEATGARGGDLLVTDPRTGEILAMASLRDGASTHLGGITTPYEPGSTLKPFTVAGLLREGKAALEDSVDTGDGRWQVHGRTITDVQRVGRVTLAHALQVSSNVGIAKMAQALTPDEQYEVIRDFGFGVRTGIQLPGEAPGVLRRPTEWSRQSPASLAIGYEVSVTPVQMAMAYGALANGGILMEPRMVRELRDDRGQVVQSFEPSAVRRVMSEEVAALVSGALVGAVETGTGTRAQLASFAVAGKSGTSRIFSQTGGYEGGAYFASFAGFFPAEDPQLVVFVKLERPQGAYYGGATAAPVTRATMEAILAARKPPLDRAALAGIARQHQAAASPPLHAHDTRAGAEVMPALFATREDPAEFAMDRMFKEALLNDGGLGLPEVAGMTTRAAARRLHAMGLAVTWDAGSVVDGTLPVAGTLVQPGDTVHLRGRLTRSEPASRTLADRGRNE